MKLVIALFFLIFASVELVAQNTTSKKTSTQHSKKIKKQKKPFTSHSGPGLENTGTAAITLTHNDTANYQGKGKKGISARKGGVKKSNHKG